MVVFLRKALYSAQKYKILQKYDRLTCSFAIALMTILCRLPPPLWWFLLIEFKQKDAFYPTPPVLSKKTEKKIDNFYNLWYYNIVDRGAFLNQ